MVPFQSESYWATQLKRMLDDQKPEDVHLDYKDKESLLPPGRGGGGLDKKKRAEDISKDVSSFLNSDGGVLVYGVPESEDPSRTGGSPIPGGPEIGFQRGQITKETIEDLITSNIQPRPGPDLFRVNEVPYCDRTVFIVEVAIGLGEAWQAKDKRYYRRFNYKAEPMDHYEVAMVRNRTIEPNLKLVFGLSDRWETGWSSTEYFDRYEDDVQIHIGIQNTQNSMAEAALIELGLYPGANSDITAKLAQGRIPNDILPAEFQPVGVRKIDSLDYLGRMGVHVAWGQLYWNGANPRLGGKYSPVFRTETPFPVSVFSKGKVTTLGSRFPLLHAACFWRIQAPNMKTTAGSVELWTGKGSAPTSPDTTALGIVANEKHWNMM